MNAVFIRKIMCAVCTAVILAGCSLSNTPAEGDSSQKNVESSAAGKDTENIKDNSDEDQAGEENAVSETEFVLNDSIVEFSQPSGIFGDSFSLELTGGNGKIYYTTDGSDPRDSETRLEYTGAFEVTDQSDRPNVVSAVDPLEIAGSFCDYDRAKNTFVSKLSAPSDSDVDKCTVVRAAAQADDGTFSQTSSCAYYFGTAEEHIQGLKENCEASGQKLAVMSITADYGDLFDPKKGIYVKGDIFDKAFEEYRGDIDGETARKLDANYKQKGREWERSCHMELMEWDTEGAETVLSQDCGVRVQGNYSRSDLQKGLRLYARKSYGDNNFNYAVFGDSVKDSSGKTLDKFKTLVLRAGGNCAFTAKFNDTYWQDVSKEMDCSTKAGRPCVVYLNGEYWGLYILEEDYSNDYFEDRYGVDKSSVIVYKGDAEALKLGYKLDEGDLPAGETNESYYFEELLEFFKEHKDLSDDADLEEFSKLVDTESARDYFLAEVWINNKWDWPGKNWSMWKTASPANASEYDDGRWRFMFYDMEFGGVSGESDAYTNTVKEDNYKELGLLDFGTNNPAVLTYAYLMTNQGFREDYNSRLLELSSGAYKKETLISKLDEYVSVYEPLMDQFFKRYPGTGSAEEAIHGGYASADCIRAFVGKREDNIQGIVDWINEQF